MATSKRQVARKFTKQIKRTLKAKYLLYLPNGYDRYKKKAWPLMLFLHGAGERGNDPEQVKKHGPPKLIEAGKDLPFVVVSPQCPGNQWWSTETLSHLIDRIVANYRIDENRIYVTGLSMGGYGTWDLAITYPDRFAAIAPICGGGSPHKTRLIAHLPIWVFHGAKDQAVPVHESVIMVEALKRFGARVKFRVYPKAGHDSWTKTYDNPRLYEWFLKHRRRKPAGK